MEDAWKGRRDEGALAISPAMKLFLSWSPAELCCPCDIAKGHMCTIVKRRDFKLPEGFAEKRTGDSHRSMSKII